jgi:hypothetical protein
LLKTDVVGKSWEKGTGLEQKLLVNANKNQVNSFPHSGTAEKFNRFEEKKKFI